MKCVKIQGVGFDCLILINIGLTRVLLTSSCAFAVISVPIMFLRADCFSIPV
jgi:hypothetical protein